MSTIQSGLFLAVLLFGFAMICQTQEQKFYSQAHAKVTNVSAQASYWRQM